MTWIKKWNNDTEIIVGGFEIPAYLVISQLKIMYIYNCKYIIQLRGFKVVTEAMVLRGVYRNGRAEEDGSHAEDASDELVPQVPIKVLAGSVQMGRKAEHLEESSTVGYGSGDAAVGCELLVERARRTGMKHEKPGFQEQIQVSA